MERKIIISEQPKCKTCGKLMDEWIQFANEHEHNECRKIRISNDIENIIKSLFRDALNNEKDESNNSRE